MRRVLKFGAGAGYRLFQSGPLGFVVIQNDEPVGLRMDQNPLGQPREDRFGIQAGEIGSERQRLGQGVEVQNGAEGHFGKLAPIVALRRRCML